MAAPAATDGPAAAGGRRLWATREVPPAGADVAGDLPRYRRWVREREQARAAAGASTGGPALDLVMVVRAPDPALLDAALSSIACQRSSAWSLAVAVVRDAPGAPDAGEQITASIAPGWLRLLRCPPGTPDAMALEIAVDAGDAPAVLLVGQHDRLAPDAVALLAGALVGADAAYADEDRFDGRGDAVDPALKPDWSPELALSSPYVGRPLALRRTVLRAAGGVGGAPGPPPCTVATGSLEHDLVLRVAEHTDRVAHVAEVLCHRPSARPGAGTDGEPPQTRAAVIAALSRRGEDADPLPVRYPGAWSIRRRAPAGCSVTAVIPFRDQARLLRACVDSLRATLGEVPLHLLLVDNGSEEPETETLLDRLCAAPATTVLRRPGPFNWAAVNNEAAAHATGDVLLFCNNDVEATAAGWLDALAAQATRPGIGAAGARLLYPDGRVQHAGVVLGLSGAAGHVLAGLPGTEAGYLGMAVVARDCSAVTGACMATARSVFERLDGFDVGLGFDLNDVDYCLRAAESGLRTVLEPRATLVHHESPTRGTSGHPADIVRFLDRWDHKVLAGDPYLNAHLTRADGSAALADPGEAQRWAQWRSHVEGAVAAAGGAGETGPP